MPVAPTAESTKNLEEAWVAAQAAEISPEHFEEQEEEPRMEDEEGDAAPAAEAEGSPEMCRWAGWEDDCEEEDETPHPVPTPSTSKGSGKKGRGGRGALRAGLNRLAGERL